VDKPAAPAEAPTQALLRIAQCYGTPTYAYEIARIRYQVQRLRTNLPQEIDLLYSLKANPSLGICRLMSRSGLGADVASSGELLTALEAGFPPQHISVSGPYKSPETLAQVCSTPGITISIDSITELRELAKSNQAYRAHLRLRPDYASSATVDTGSNSRFGISFSDLPDCSEYLASEAVKVVGFHVFSGSQVLDAMSIIQHLRGAMDLSLRAAEVLRVTPEVFNLGGGFGIPYGPADEELDLEPIGAELSELIKRASPARIVLELGRYLVAQAGWYLTRVVGNQTNEGRQAVVVDGGTHQRSDACRLGLRTTARAPLVLNKTSQPVAATDVLGCLCLPDDVLAEASQLPALEVGDVLAFSNAGAYGLSASPALFLSHAIPAEVGFDGKTMELFRSRTTAQFFLNNQNFSSLSD